MAIGANWKEIWVEAIWADVWTQTASAPGGNGMVTDIETDIESDIERDLD